MSLSGLQYPIPCGVWGGMYVGTKVIVEARSQYRCIPQSLAIEPGVCQFGKI